MKFKNGKTHAVVRTVSELKELLNELPDEMEVHSDFEPCIDAVILHNSQGEEWLSFDEGMTYGDEEDA